jgi:hypothetical protein
MNKDEILTYFVCGIGLILNVVATILLFAFVFFALFESFKYLLF